MKPIKSDKQFYPLSNGKSGIGTKQSRLIRSTPTHLPHIHLVPITFIAVLLFGLSLSPATEANPDRKILPPALDACAHLQPPTGSKISYHAYASGNQIYRWNGVTWEYVFRDATLFSDAKRRSAIGLHYAGPIWESNNGSRVTGTALDRCTPDTDAVPWLLLKAVSSEGPGIFQGTTYIQRINTTGGKQPEKPGAFVGESVKVPYTAEYYFYRNKHDG